MRFDSCTLALIAGGRGSRLGGVVKAHLRLADGRTVLQRTLDELGPLVDDVIVVADDASAFPSLCVVPDLLPGKGAPGGVHAACCAARTEWVLALASDLPFVSAAVLGVLWDARADADAVVASLVPGRFEPLHAFYRAAACELAFEPLLRAGNPGFAQLLDEIAVRGVTPAELRAVDPSLRSFANINTHDDLAEAGLLRPLER